MGIIIGICAGAVLRSVIAQEFAEFVRIRSYKRSREQEETAKALRGGLSVQDYQFKHNYVLKMAAGKEK